MRLKVLCILLFVSFLLLNTNVIAGTIDMGDGNKSFRTTVPVSDSSFIIKGRMVDPRMAGEWGVYCTFSNPTEFRYKMLNDQRREGNTQKPLTRTAFRGPVKWENGIGVISNIQVELIIIKAPPGTMMTIRWYSLKDERL